MVNFFDIDGSITDGRDKYGEITFEIKKVDRNNQSAIDEVLQNIIENAVKYGDGKEITIAFSREDDCQLVHIRNSGCTLSENELPHIFDSFWRGSNVGSNSGSGLGLYICRTLMRKINGDIFAEIQESDMIVTAVFAIS